MFLLKKVVYNCDEVKVILCVLIGKVVYNIGGYMIYFIFCILVN